MTALFTSLMPYLLMVGAAVVAFVGYGVQQRMAGKRAAKVEQAIAEKKAVDTARKIDAEVDALKPADVREELKKWSTD
jgi:hypothetical protein